MEEPPDYVSDSDFETCIELPVEAWARQARARSLHARTGPNLASNRENREISGTLSTDDSAIRQVQLTTVELHPDTTPRFVDFTTGVETVDLATGVETLDLMAIDMASPSQVSADMPASSQYPSDRDPNDLLSQHAFQRPLHLVASAANQNSIPQDIPPELNTFLDTAPRRLRDRTVLQLHPYTLEREQYRRSLQSRGIHDGSRNHLSKERDTNPREETQGGTAHHLHAQDDVDWQSQLDDVDELFSSQIGDSQMPDSFGASQTVFAPSMLRSNLIADDEESSDDDIFMGPRDRRQTSAEPRITVSSPPTLLSSGSDFDDSSDSSGPEPDQLADLKKRVRGVLPPSFITLDYLKKRQQPDKRKSRTAQPQVAARGVARSKIGPHRPTETAYSDASAGVFPPLNRSPSTSPTLAPHLELDSRHVEDSMMQDIQLNAGLADVEDIVVLSISEAPSVSPSRSSLPDFESDDDLMEEDVVDHMAQPSAASRNRRQTHIHGTATKRKPELRSNQHGAKYSKSSTGKRTTVSKSTRRTPVVPAARRRQSGIHVSRSKGISSSSRPTSKRAPASAQSKISNSKRASKTRQRISVVDMVNHSSQRRPQPQFMSIASRTARIRSDPPRPDNPSRKVIHIDDGDSSKPEVKTMQRWESGKLYERLSSSGQFGTNLTKPMVSAESKHGQSLKHKKRQPLAQLSQNMSRFRTTIVEDTSGSYIVKHRTTRKQARPTLEHMTAALRENRDGDKTTERLPAPKQHRGLKRKPEAPVNILPEDNLARDVLASTSKNIAFTSECFQVFHLQPILPDVHFANDSMFAALFLRDTMPTQIGPSVIFLGPELGSISIHSGGKIDSIPSFAVLQDWLEKSYLETDMPMPSAMGSQSWYAYELFLFLVGALTGRTEFVLDESSREILRHQCRLLINQISQTESSGSGYKGTEFSLLLLNLCLGLLYALWTSADAPLSRSLAENDVKACSNLLLETFIIWGSHPLMRSIQRRRNLLRRSIGREDVHFEAAAVATKVLDKMSQTSSTVMSFDFSFTAIAKHRGVEGPLDSHNLKIYEAVWKCLFAFSCIYKFLGVGTRPTWDTVKSMTAAVCDFTNSFTAVDGATRYLRSTLLRCAVLVLEWDWSSPLELCLSVLPLFSKQKVAFQNLESSGGHFSLLYYKERTSGGAVGGATAFDSLLRLISMALRKARDTESSVVMMRFVDRVFPLNGGMYLMSSELSIARLEALANQYSLILTLFTDSDKRSRPHIERFRQFIRLDASHLEARELSFCAWKCVTEFLLYEGEDISGAGLWFDDFIDCSVDDLVENGLSGQTETEKALKERNVSTYNMFLRKLLRGVSELLCNKRITQLQDEFPNEQTSSWKNHWIKLLRKSFSKLLQAEIPEAIRVEAQTVVRNYFKAFSNSRSFDDFEPDSLEDSGCHDSLPADMAAWIRECLLNEYFEYLDSILRSSVEDSEVTTVDAIQVYVLIAQFLTRHTTDIKWSWFLVTRYSWSSLAQTVKCLEYEPLYLSYLLDAAPELAIAHSELLARRYVEFLARPQLVNEFQYWRAFRQSALSTPIGRLVAHDRGLSDFDREFLIQDLLQSVASADNDMKDTILSWLFRSLKSALVRLKGHHTAAAYSLLVERVLQWTSEWMPDCRNADLIWFSDPNNFHRSDPLQADVLIARKWLRSEQTQGVSSYVVNLLESNVGRSSVERFTTVMARAGFEEIMTGNEAPGWYCFANEIIGTYIQLIKRGEPASWNFLPAQLRAVGDALTLLMVNGHKVDANKYAHLLALSASLLSGGLPVNALSHNAFWAWCTALFEVLRLLVYQSEGTIEALGDQQTIVSEMLEYAIRLLDLDKGVEWRSVEQSESRIFHYATVYGSMRKFEIVLGLGLKGPSGAVLKFDSKYQNAARNAIVEYIRAVFQHSWLHDQIPSVLERLEASRDPDRKHLLGWLAMTSSLRRDTDLVVTSFDHLFI